MERRRLSLNTKGNTKALPLSSTSMEERSEDGILKIEFAKQKEDSVHLAELEFTVAMEEALAVLLELLFVFYAAAAAYAFSAGGQEAEEDMETMLS